jgi:large subunit ribosomal protein L36
MSGAQARDGPSPGIGRGIPALAIVFYGAVLQALRQEEAAMKVRSSIRSLKRIPGSRVVRRRGKVFVINRLNPRWKARQG